jgi:hypothetical protein
MGSDVHRRPTATVRSDDVNAGPDFVREAVQNRGGAMRENCIWTAGEYSRKQVPVPGQQSVPDGIDALVDAMKASGRRPLPRNLLVEIWHLPQSHQPVLPIRQISQAFIEFHPTASPTGRFAAT